MMTYDFGIAWRASFRAEQSGLLMTESPRALEALLKSPFGCDLNVRATWDARADDIGAPEKLGATASLKKLLRAGRTLYLAHEHVARDRADLRFEIGPGPAGLVMGAIIRGEHLSRLGVTALDAYADLITDLAVAWRSKGIRLTEASAQPTRRSTAFEYPRVRPPRLTKPTRACSAIMDVLDRNIADSAKHPDTAIATRTLAASSLPDGVHRRERDGVVMIRWVDNPCDGNQLAAAASAHERWLYALLPSTIESTYNEAGDFRLPAASEEPPRPGLDLLTRRGASYFGHIVSAETRMLPAPNRAALGIEEIRLLAPSREAALALASDARTAGYDRVVYRDEAGALWDPSPPGPWLAT